MAASIWDILKERKSAAKSKGAARGQTDWSRSGAARGQTDLEVFVEKLLNRSDPEATKSRLAWLQALIQNSQAASRGGLRLGGLVILFVARGGPRRGIGGGPVHHTRLSQRERLAGPSV